MAPKSRLFISQCLYRIGSGGPDRVEAYGEQCDKQHHDAGDGKIQPAYGGLVGKIPQPPIGSPISYRYGNDDRDTRTGPRECIFSMLPPGYPLSLEWYPAQLL